MVRGMAIILMISVESIVLGGTALFFLSFLTYFEDFVFLNAIWGFSCLVLRMEVS